MSGENSGRGRGGFGQRRGQGGSRGRGRFDHKKHFGTKVNRSKEEGDEIKRLKARYNEIVSSSIENFLDFPLSQKTQKALKEAEYEVPTEIQRESIGLALQGHDILGAAKTGSGKTLAFLIPILEALFQLKWSSMDGMGALIISPTRELAYQTFEVLRNVGKHHDFSAGLVIGGKHVKEEAECIPRTNIVICTPGRLLQHMDETPYFHADNLQVLVLDEADRMLDMGFQQALDAIIENLPAKRQTLLFSATQTKSVKDLARLSLKTPMYVSVHEHAQYSTPAQLEQSYIVCELHEKMDVLWSFIKNHLKTKIIVFISSCKQVRFVHEVFRRQRPGVVVLALHGAMPQLKRMATYDQFCRKEFCVLFATDIAARGLDFPEVNWVVQMDCPEDANTYIHRAGRTARYEENGEALLLLTPSEEDGMIAQLNEKKIPINKIKVNPKRLWSLQSRLESLLASDVTMKEFAQKAFVSYIRSVFLMSNKKVFDVSKIDTDKFSASLGLAIPPRIRFLQKERKKKEIKNQNQDKMDAQKILDMFTNTAKPLKGTKAAIPQTSTEPGESGSEEEESGSEEEESGSEEEESGSKEEESGSEENESSSDEDEKELAEVKNQKLKSFSFNIGDDDLDDILTVKKVGQIEEEEEDDEDIQSELTSKTKKTKALTKAMLAKKIQKKQLVVNSKVVFDDEGTEIRDRLKQQAKLSQGEKEEEEYEGGINIEQARKILQEEDKIDKLIDRERIKKMHREKKLKEKEKRRKEKEPKEDEPEAVLDGDTTGSVFDFIPDPDKIYGPKGSDSEEETDDDRPPNKKARKENKNERDDTDDEDDSDEESDGEDDEDDSGDESDENSKESYQNKSDQEVMDTGLSLADDEALALKLLQS